ncbi:MAG: hypothetical protein ACTS4Y_01715, partial [Candidatus Hodgkinia cicadicola]
MNSNIREENQEEQNVEDNVINDINDNNVENDTDSDDDTVIISDSDHDFNSPPGDSYSDSDSNIDYDERIQNIILRANNISGISRGEFQPVQHGITFHLYVMFSELNYLRTVWNHLRDIPNYTNKKRFYNFTLYKLNKTRYGVDNLVLDDVDKLINCNYRDRAWTDNIFQVPHCVNSVKSCVSGILVNKNIVKAINARSMGNLRLSLCLCDHNVTLERMCIYNYNDCSYRKTDRTSSCYSVEQKYPFTCSRFLQSFNEYRKANRIKLVDYCAKHKRWLLARPFGFDLLTLI